jgi:heme oxygenase
VSADERTAPLSARLKAATRSSHARAERAGAMALLLRGALDGPSYARLLRALHALYDALEGALRRHAAHPAIAPLDAATLYRTNALAHDLAALRAAGIADPRPEPPAAARDYVARLARLEAREPVRLVAHAYVRYLGDLAGGQLLAPIVERTYRLAPGDATRFYAYGSRDAAAARAGALRAAIDALPIATAEADAIVDEAVDAFERHVALFEEISADVAPQAAGPACTDGDAVAQRASSSAASRTRR